MSASSIAKVGDIVCAFNDKGEISSEMAASPNLIAQNTIPLWLGLVKEVVGDGRPRLFASAAQADVDANGFNIQWYAPKWDIPKVENYARKNQAEGWIDEILKGEKERAHARSCEAEWKLTTTCHKCGKTSRHCKCEGGIALSEFRMASTIGPVLGVSSTEVFTKQKCQLRAKVRQTFSQCCLLARKIDLSGSTSGSGSDSDDDDLF